MSCTSEITRIHMGCQLDFILDYIVRGHPEWLIEFWLCCDSINLIIISNIQVICISFYHDHPLVGTNLWSHILTNCICSRFFMVTYLCSFYYRVCGTIYNRRRLVYIIQFPLQSLCYLIFHMTHHCWRCPLTFCNMKASTSFT